MNTKDIKILVINPGSTSMKVSLYSNEENLFSANMEVPADRLSTFHDMYEQYLYRKAMILDEMKEHGYAMDGVDIFLARAGGIVPGPGGIYTVNAKLLDMNDLHKESTTAQCMGSQMVTDFSAEYNGAGYVINDSAVDEFIDIARVTGLKGVWRDCYAHALNQRAAGEMAAKARGLRYEEASFVVAHLGGGISIGAHRCGRIIDTSNLMGDGPMSPTRAGCLPTGTVTTMIMSGKATAKDLMKRSIGYGGGLLDHLGTADGREVEQRIQDGDRYAELVYDGMIYQISQTIARMAVALEGRADAIVLTGGLSHSKRIQNGVRKYCGWIAPIDIFAGEYETEAMVSAALRVARGEETVHEYTGIPVFDSSEYVK